MLIRFIAEYDDGSREPLDIDSYDLRSGDWVARIIAGERQREPIAFPQLKDGKIVRVYRDVEDDELIPNEPQDEEWHD
jgi:hypothetical protein